MQRRGPTTTYAHQVYGRLAGDGMLSRAHVINPGRLRAWIRRTRPGIRRDFLLYKLALLELWCRIVFGGERADERVRGIV